MITETKKQKIVEILNGLTYSEIIELFREIRNDIENKVNLEIVRNMV